MNNNRCIACGAIIPEGLQVCPECENLTEKQIEKTKELAELLYNETDTLLYLESKTAAKFLIQKGYCEKSEVAREIFEEIENKLKSVYVKWIDDNFYKLDGYELDCVEAMFNKDLDLAKLEKKYIGEQ